jgi:hypothetical protein
MLLLPLRPRHAASPRRSRLHGEHTRALHPRALTPGVRSGTPRAASRTIPSTLISSPTLWRSACRLVPASGARARTRASYPAVRQGGCCLTRAGGRRRQDVHLFPPVIDEAKLRAMCRCVRL